MRIRGLGVIGEAVLELGSGLTVVTGETGAGKTMVVTGLGLLLGSRADAGAVRVGATSAVVEGLLRVDPEGPVAARARDAGAELDDDTLLVARTVTSEGRSRAHLGGRSVPVGLLAELAPELVAVHGQADQIRLQTPARQRELLDRYAGPALSAPLTAYTECFDRLRVVEVELDEVRTRGRERAREADLLRHGLAEVEAVDPQPGEDTASATELSRLTHSDALREAAERPTPPLVATTTTRARTAGGQRAPWSRRGGRSRVRRSDSIRRPAAGRAGWPRSGSWRRTSAASWRRTPRCRGGPRPAGRARRSGWRCCAV